LCADEKQLQNLASEGHGSAFCCTEESNLRSISGIAELHSCGKRFIVQNMNIVKENRGPTLCGLRRRPHRGKARRARRDMTYARHQPGWAFERLCELSGARERGARGATSAGARGEQPRSQTPGIQGCRPRWLPPLPFILAGSGRPNHSISALAI